MTVPSPEWRHFITTAYELLPAIANLPISRWPVTQTTRTRAVCRS